MERVDLQLAQQRIDVAILGLTISDAFQENVDEIWAAERRAQSTISEPIQKIERLIENSDPSISDESWKVEFSAAMNDFESAIPAFDKELENARKALDRFKRRLFIAKMMTEGPPDEYLQLVEGVQAEHKKISLEIQDRIRSFKDKIQRSRAGDIPPVAERSGEGG